MSTENVAILFTDVVGSTALSQRLSAEIADEVRRGHFSLLRQSIVASGGAEVKNLGDGMMAVFSATSSALQCAVGMQQEVERENRASPSPVGLRIGVSCGEATKEDEDYFGDPVIEAARLCARADGGQILRHRPGQGHGWSPQHTPFGADRCPRTEGPAPGGGKLRGRLGAARRGSGRAAEVCLCPLVSPTARTSG